MYISSSNESEGPEYTVSRINHYIPLIINKMVANGTFITFLKDRGIVPYETKDITLADPSFRFLSLSGRYHLLCLIKDWHQDHQIDDNYHLDELDVLSKEIRYAIKKNNDVITDRLTEIKDFINFGPKRVKWYHNPIIKILTCIMVLSTLGFLTELKLRD